MTTVSTIAVRYSKMSAWPTSMKALEMISAVSRKSWKRVKMAVTHARTGWSSHVYLSQWKLPRYQWYQIHQELKNWEAPGRVSDLRTPRPELRLPQPHDHKPPGHQTPLHAQPMRIPPDRARRVPSVCQEHAIALHSFICSHSPVRNNNLSLGPLPGECCEFP